jgi:enoyl-CoA hydratase/carnithine racemase
VLTGEKSFITSGSAAEFFLILAETPAGVSVFAVPAGIEDLSTYAGTNSATFGLRMLLAEPINAKTALLWGLVRETWPKSQVLARSSEIALRLAKGPLTALAQIRSLQASAFNHSLERQLRDERFAQQSSSADCLEGVSAFFEKREPHFLV